MNNIKHYRDVDGVTHSEGVIGGDVTLCISPLEGENGDAEMIETTAAIDCDYCISIIRFCKRIREGEIKPPFQRCRS
jgi:hypothetical protein